MLLTLLLQTATTKTTITTDGILPAVYGTLIAAVLSLAASLYATVTSSKTARDVAALSAQVNRESAALSAKTAQELKDKDYTNDFFKKIIEKRLKAWEEAELIIAPLSNKRRDSRDGKRLPSCFKDLESLDETMQKLIDLTAPAFWLGPEFNTAIFQLHAKLRQIRDEGKEITDEGIVNRFTDNVMLWDAGKKHNAEFSRLVEAIVKVLGEQIVNLPNVEKFFEQLKHLGVGE